ncbi:hypothetical protein [Hymenobacter chitinivorans]|uniref:Uncharacterized protein n=1 Tax=Hymenobacter chitinivorans DSM 11115 TaxID=1121954 RepID=A0A2M9BA45_9BACT|nr:hypothetical protein [Hymenobacter chitinivorans]PJJ54805.1 hypothetical protein CLV45_3151 [Hymenobacter chitinivorans DSM 11115]
MNSNKLYTVLLEGNTLGTTLLEKADAPMGVVFGKIDFVAIKSGYAFFKSYCLGKGVVFDDIPEERCISTQGIPGLMVIAEGGVEIKGLACTVSGMDSDEFEICLIGVPYPAYEEEFPHHVQAYSQRWEQAGE